MDSLTRGTIAKIESGVRRVTADEVAVLARVLGVTATDLLETTGPIVLHLSDPQFGGEHRLGGGGRTIGEDLRDLEDSLGLKPEVVVVSGDLTKTGAEREFEEALSFLEQLSDDTGIERRRMILVPGDQDVSRDASRAYFRRCEADDRVPQPPYWPKWEPFIALLSRLYTGEKAVAFDAEHPWTLFELPELRLVLAGLNSTMADSHREEDHYGWVGADQLRWFAERLGALEERGWLRIGVVHHNVVRGVVADNENLRDADDLERILAPHLDLLLHGHTHDATLHRLSNGLPVLSTGGAPVTAVAHPAEVPHRYQLVHVHANRVERWARTFQPDQGRWAPDTRVSPDGHSWDDAREERLMRLADTVSHAADVDVARRSRVSGQEAARLFLSYAEEDAETALQIATWLGRHGFEVYHWQDPRQRGGRFVERMEEEINQADAFLALLSPNYLASPWCRWERELAVHREVDLRPSDPAHAFVHVLQVAETLYPQAGFLQAYDWLDLTTAETKEQELRVLADRLRTSSEAASPGPGAASLDRVLGLFRDRRDELDRVQRGLTNASGPHFWLVIAPPDLGKSWFLDRLAAEMAPPEQSNSGAASRWMARLVDVREQPLAARSDAALLLASLFGLAPPVTIEPNTLRDIAQRISRGGEPYLCLLDSAELLERETAKTLRSCVSQIYQRVQQAGSIDVRLAVVVASRREAEWRGVGPAPPRATQPRAAMKVGGVRQALDDLAQQMHRTFAATELQQNAIRVHHLSEGLPALLVACLEWILREQWHDMERLESQELFEELAQPYIEQDLLSVESLLPQGGRNLKEKRGALAEAFRVLAPYRLFTQSHLRHHFQWDPAFRQALGRLGWTIEDLWKAIDETALLSRLLNEPWQAIYPAIRRLLYRYYYRSERQRTDAHREARKFVEVWAAKQAGTEQVMGLVECLWHEAAILSLDRPAELERDLGESARNFSRSLKESPAYTVAELREYAAERVTNDDELQEAVGHIPGLLERLAAIVTSPQESRNE